MKTRTAFTVGAALFAFALTACESSQSSTTKNTSRNAPVNQPQGASSHNYPTCAELVKQPVVADMPEMCLQANGKLLQITSVNCDSYQLYGFDAAATGSTEYYGRTGRPWKSTNSIADDPEYGFLFWKSCHTEAPATP